jgi:multidrug efflux system membrane fusion protein
MHRGIIRNRRRRQHFLLGMACLVGVLPVACTKKVTAAPERPPTLVTVSAAVSRDVPVYLDEIGKNGAFESVTVTPQVAGRITERHFEDGANLQKGQLLFVIDPRPFQAQLDSAQANLAQAKAALELAKIQFARDEELVGTRAISKQDYDTKKSTVDVDQAQVEAAEAALETAKLNLEYCYIHSPIEGRAGARLVDIGNVVQTNTTPLLLIQRLNPIYADFTITERDLPGAQKQMARANLDARVRLPSDGDDGVRTGKVTFLDNAVQNATGTVNLRATIPNPDHHFWPGQFVNVRLVLATDKGAVMIPSEATQISQKGPFVYVVKPDQTAELRVITLGQRQGGNVVVTNGLVAGENVVLTGQLTVVPGSKVKVVESTPDGVNPTGKSGGDESKGGGGQS